MDSQLHLVATHTESDEGRPCAKLFGSFRLSGADGQTIGLPNRRARAILGLLCTDPDQPLERDQLCGLLWPGRFQAHAKASLRQCLFELGKQLQPLGADILIVTRQSVAISPGAIATDLGDLEEALRCRAAVAAARILGAIETAPLLERMEFGEAFAALLDRRRQSVEQRLIAATQEALVDLQATADLNGHRLLADAWRMRDPGFEPGAGGAARHAEARLAVLPFRLLGPTEGRDYFGDGMAEELITALGKIPELQVAGRTSSFHFRDSDRAPTEIAEALRVSHLLEGSVLCAGEELRIHVHLIDGSSGFELWAQRYDGTMSGLFELQDAVAEAVTAAIGNALGITLVPPKVAGMTYSKQAYDLFLQGRAICARIIGDGVLDKGIDLLQQAVTIDPDFAECWIALAEAHQLVAVYTQCPDRPAAIRRMADCAHHAIALAPGLGYPHSLLGIERWTNGDVVGALDLAFRAQRLEPGNPAVTMRLAVFLVYCGLINRAEPYMLAAIDQDPIDPRKYAPLWALHMARGELHAARTAAQRVVDLGLPSVYLALTNAALGEHDLAVEQYQLTKHLVNRMILPPISTGTMTAEAMDAYWLIAAKGICSGNEADRIAYMQLLDFLYATLPDKGDLAIAGPAIMTGHADLAFKVLGEHGSAANMLTFIELWTPFSPVCHIWQHPEFIPFAQRIGMAAAWDNYGWPDLLPRPDNSPAPN